MAPERGISITQTSANSCNCELTALSCVGCMLSTAYCGKCICKLMFIYDASETTWQAEVP